VRRGIIERREGGGGREGEREQGREKEGRKGEKSEEERKGSEEITQVRFHPKEVRLLG
jgi:hypothetical protein